jgi:serine protease Do
MASLKSGIVIGVAAAGVAAAALAAGGVRWTPNTMSVQRVPTTLASTAMVFSPPPGAPLSFADIFEKVSPAVVSIEVTSRVTAHDLQGMPGFPGLPDLTPKGDDGDPAPTQKAESQGSGFFISADGYIVTNNHVVENAEDIKVTLKDGRILPARVIGHDKATDLAVVKVEGHNYPFVDFENSAIPWASATRPRRASSRPMAATSATASSTSSRSTRRSISAIPAVRPSTSTAA